MHNVIQPAAAHKFKHLMVSVNHEHIDDLMQLLLVALGYLGIEHTHALKCLPSLSV